MHNNMCLAFDSAKIALSGGLSACVAVDKCTKPTYEQCPVGHGTQKDIAQGHKIYAVVTQAKKGKQQGETRGEWGED